MLSIEQHRTMVAAVVSRDDAQDGQSLCPAGDGRSRVCHHVQPLPLGEVVGDQHTAALLQPRIAFVSTHASCRRNCGVSMKPGLIATTAIRSFTKGLTLQRTVGFDPLHVRQRTAVRSPISAFRGNSSQPPSVATDDTTRSPLRMNQSRSDSRKLRATDDTVMASVRLNAITAAVTPVRAGHAARLSTATRPAKPGHPGKHSLEKAHEPRP